MYAILKRQCIETVRWSVE